MVNYIVKRLAQGLLLAVAVSITIFSLLYLMPGDPIENLVGEQTSEERKDQLRHEYGLDQPPVTQYVNWVKKAIHGDFGISLNSKMQVSQMMKARIPITLKLCGISLFVQLLISIPIGLLAAYKKDSWFDRAVMAISMFLTAIPSFWIAIVLMLIFGVKLNWLPVTGFTTWKHYIMPIAAMVVGGIASLVRLTKTEVLDVIREKYVITAYAKGLGRRAVMVRHVLRNALILVVVMTFLSLPWIIAGGVIIENIFGIPGMGSLLTFSIVNLDFPIVQAVILVISILTVIANLAADIVTAMLDPRIKASINEGGD